MKSSPKYTMQYLGFFALGLLVLPACNPLDFFKKKNKDITSKGTESQAAVLSADTLVSLDGKPVVTMADLERDYKQVLEERPELASFEQLVKQNLLQGLAQQVVIDRYVEENHLDESEVYKQDLALMEKLIKRRLNVKYFRDANPVDVTDAEVTEYYEKNKETFPDLIISRGGVNVAGVSFEKEAQAKDFLAKVQASDKEGLEKVATQNNVAKTFRDFKLVNQQSVGVDPVIKNAVASLTKFPHVQLVKASDNTYWVIRAIGKEDAKYRPLDEQVKSGLRQFLTQEKQMKALEERINTLKKKYNVEVNEKAFPVGANVPGEMPEQVGSLHNEHGNEMEDEAFDVA